MSDERTGLEKLVEDAAELLEATVRTEDGIFHLTVPIAAEGDGDLEEGEEIEEEEDPSLLVEIALSTSEDGSTVYATRRLCANDGSHDLEELLRAVSATVHVQLSIDDDDDLVLGGAAPITSDAEWIADMIGEMAEFASSIAEDAAPAEEA